MPASPSMYVILLSVLAVAMNPGSKVNTPCSLVRFEMSSASGPIVPETAFSGVVFPVARFLSSYFVLMRCSDRGVWVDLWGFVYDPAALHGRTSESRERPPNRAGSRIHTRQVERRHSGRRQLRRRHRRFAPARLRNEIESRLSPPPRTSCGIYRRDRRYPQFSACPCRTDGSWSTLRPADHG